MTETCSYLDAENISFLYNSHWQLICMAIVRVMVVDQSESFIAILVVCFLRIGENEENLALCHI